MMGLFDRNPENGALVSPVGPTSGGGGGSALTVQDEGSTLSAAVTSINFVGAGVTATGAASVTVTIPGGGSFNPAATSNNFLDLNQFSFSSIYNSNYWGGPIDGIVFDSTVLNTLGNANGFGAIFSSDRATGATAEIMIRTGDATVSGVAGRVSLRGGTSTASTGGELYLQGGDGVAGGIIGLAAGSGSAGLGGKVQLDSGAGTTSSGDIILQVASSATRGVFKFLRVGVPSVSGQVWTASATDGTGYWAAASGGANTTLSNLVNTIAIPNGVDILPLTSGNPSLGSASKNFNQVHIGQVRVYSGGSVTGIILASALPSGAPTAFGLYGLTSGNISLPVMAMTESSSSVTGTGTGNVNIETGNMTGAGGTVPTGLIRVKTGATTNTLANGNTGSLFFETGNAIGTVSGNSGAITLQTGTSTAGTRGAITMNARNLNLTNAPLGTSWLPDATGTRNLGDTNTRFLLVFANAVFAGSGVNIGGRMVNTLTTPTGISAFGMNAVEEARVTAVCSLDTATPSVHSGALLLESGNATAATSNSGNIKLQTGTATGTRGNITLNAPTISFAGSAAPDADATRDCGSNFNNWSQVYSRNVTGNTGNMTVGSGINTTFTATFSSGDLSSASASGAVVIKSGANSGAGNSGSVTIQTGTVVGGTRGKIILSALSIEPQNDVVPSGVGAIDLGSSNNPFRALVNTLVQLQVGTTQHARLATVDTTPTGITTSVSLSTFQTSKQLALFTLNGTVTNNVLIETGNASAGASGDIKLTTGTATGARGNVLINSANYNLKTWSDTWWGGTVAGLNLAQGQGTLNVIAIGTDAHASNSTSLGADLFFGTGNKPGASSTLDTGRVWFHTGDNAGSGDTGGFYLFTGSATGAGNSGSVELYSGDSDTGATGYVAITSGNSFNGSTGNSVYGSGIVSAGAGSSGTATFESGAVIDGASGLVILRSGNATNGSSGDIQIYSGNTTAGGVGTISLTVGSGVTNGTAGDISINGGSVTGGTASNLNLIAGNCGSTGTAGEIFITGGTATDTDGGGIFLEAGNGGTGNGGNIFLSVGSGTVNGTIQINGSILPDASAQYDLGGSGAEFANIYVDNVYSSGNCGSKVWDILNLELNDNVGVRSVATASRLLYNAANVSMLDWINTEVIVTATKGLTLKNLASDPSGVGAGTVYFNTTVNKIKFYNGTTWETVTSA